MVADTAIEEKRRRWDESRRQLRAAGRLLKAGRFDEAFGLFTQAHDLGDDNVLCHMRGHLGRALIEMRMGKMRDASIDSCFALGAVVVSPLRRLRGVRGFGFARQPKSRNK